MIRAQSLSLFDIFMLGVGASQLSLPNHNGTDFIPAFIDHLSRLGKSTKITLLSAYDPKIGKPSYAINNEIQALKARFPHVQEISGKNTLFSERSLNDFAEIWTQSEESTQSIDYHIILLATGSPHQEMWCDTMRREIESHHVLCFCGGGLIDFISGREKRAPKWVRYLRLEWLYRSIVAPKKNLNKTKKSQSIFRLVRSSQSPFSSHQ